MLNRHLAPLNNKEWDYLENQVKETLQAHLMARRVVGVKGPLGFETHAVGLGEVKSLKIKGDVDCAQRQVLPLVELRKSFTVARAALNNLSRGASQIDLDDLIAGAKSMAEFEDRLIFKGLEKAGITGIIPASKLKTLALEGHPTAFMQTLAGGIQQLQQQTLDGKVTDTYTLVVNPDLYKYMSGHFVGSHPLVNETRQILGGPILISPVLEEALLLVNQPGHFELTLGQDFSLGYESHDSQNITLFLLESLTFRVLNPEACLVLHTPDTW